MGELLYRLLYLQDPDQLPTKLLSMYRGRVRWLTLYFTYSMILTRLYPVSLVSFNILILKGFGLTVHFCVIGSDADRSFRSNEKSRWRVFAMAGPVQMRVPSAFGVAM